MKCSVRPGMKGVQNISVTTLGGKYRIAYTVDFLRSPKRIRGKHGDPFELRQSQHVLA